MSWTPLISCSSGAATVSAMSSALAPGYVARTTTSGGTTSGYWAIGSPRMDIRPASVMTIDRTVANTGRSIKKREIMFELPY